MAIQAMVLSVVRKSAFTSATASTWICGDDVELIQQGLDAENEQDAGKDGQDASESTTGKEDSNQPDSGRENVVRAASSRSLRRRAT
eukprot:CAMPEP_0180717860 /NCGR_PEP_ID=MMETSP1038_2-20121128/14192_1 /TAXON_ID=632150 /ORGANISM="Azadinium spinosum, Strain 3D9" /LENGTH=86 /DNA_ID=CAMNT_0022750343 /DNA_START=1 /DNA_END=258 /DNA_ORIENTATION=+